jgi:hypothetical protein
MEKAKKSVITYILAKYKFEIMVVIALHDEVAISSF